MTPKTENWSTVVLLIAVGWILILWSFAIPIFEAPDEPLHWQYARYLNQTRSLPIYGSTFREANSPPLYYALIAPLAFETTLPPPIPTADRANAAPKLYLNRLADFGRYWPIRNARLATVLISVLTVWFCILSGTEASGKRTTGLLVGALAGLLPQFSFRGMNVSNDALVTMLSAVALYLMVRIVGRGFTWGIGTLAALTIASAFLSKTTAIFLPLPLFLVLSFGKSSWCAKATRAGVLGAIMLILVTPWLLRNQHLYGDLLVQRAMLTAVKDLVRIKPLWSRYFATPFPMLLATSFIGDFGWMNLPLPVWLYRIYISFMAFAVLCWLKAVVQGQIDSRVSILCTSICALNLIVVVYVNLTFSQAQGRYLFPALPAAALLCGIGLESLKGWSRKSTLITGTLLAAANLLILMTLVVPSYWLVR